MLPKTSNEVSSASENIETNTTAVQLEKMKISGSHSSVGQSIESFDSQQENVASTEDAKTDASSSTNNTLNQNR